ncbi:MAG: ClpXP protease specificity-enhancing factor SspB [Alphaproteobacteria bacterium]|nr:ClpXP protease specificity-enhancing factor SspB [Alphaproteobacteria bacterium]
MSEDLLRYDLMIEAALRDVVRETMETVGRDGLPGDHHFYITFLTKFPGVKVPDYLRKQYPDEMTIVLQYQFFGLKLEDDCIHVTLSFNNVKESLVVPIDSITTFADPSVNFALQFQNSGDDGDDGESDGPDSPDSGGSSDKEKEEKRGEVISLDKFRKK